MEISVWDSSLHSILLGDKFNALNFQETIDYLYNKLPVFSRTGAKALKIDLTNTRLVCEFLGHPEKKFKSIHIAGTNGKGSVSNMLAAVFQNHGYKTGLYTSPHLHDFRERIRINGKMIPKRFVINYVQKTKNLVEQVHPSFFELTVGMAFDYFAEEKVDIAIIETGLGGRLDSTNVITPELSVITNIGWDHTDVLGDTLQKIAGEKAGIIKPGIPVVIGETHKETKNVFLKTAKKNASDIYFADQNFHVLHSEIQKGKLLIEVEHAATKKWLKYVSDLPGHYQLKNILTVLQSVEVLKKKFRLSNQKTTAALTAVCKLTGFAGRWQTIHQKPRVVLDVGHNREGITAIIEQLRYMHYNKLLIVTGMVKDKDHAAVLPLFPKDAKYFFSNAQIPRAMPAKEFAALASQYGLKGKSYKTVQTAVEAACKSAKPGDLILICGSVYVVGEVDVAATKRLLKEIAEAGK